VHGAGDDVGAVGVEVEQRCGEGLVEFVGVEAVDVAAGLPALTPGLQVVISVWFRRFGVGLGRGPASSLPRSLPERG
jgi:hypothetical protein